MVEPEQFEITNNLYNQTYTPPPHELCFNYKKQFKNHSMEEKDKVKIADIVWGSKRYSTQLISVDDSGRLTHWDASTNQIISLIEASKTWLISVDIEKIEGKKVASGTLDAKLLIFEINTQVKKKEKNVYKNKPIHELVGHTGAVQCCKFLNSNFIISGSTDSTVCIWDLESPQRYLSRHNEHTADVLCMAVFDNDANIFLTGSSDLTINLWDIRIKKPVQATFNRHESAINTVEFFPGDEPTTFATGSDDSTIKLHDIRMKKEISTFQDTSSFESVYCINFSRSGRFIFSGTESNRVKVFDIMGKGNPLKNPFRNEVNVDCKGLIKTVKMSVDGYGLAFAGPSTDGITMIY